MAYTTHLLNARQKKQFNAGMRRKHRGKKSPAQSLTKLQKKEVVRLVKGQAETKRTAFYQTYNNGAPPALRATGTYAARGWAVQNNEILSNKTDILQLIPYVVQGTDDFTRIGQRISVSNLHVTGAVRVRYTNGVGSFVPTDLKVYIYVLQHVSLKDYTRLYNDPLTAGGNDFTQLLETGEGDTVAFAGQPQHVGMPICRQYYHVLQRKQIVLRYAGFIKNPSDGLPTPAPNSTVSVANCHSWYADYSMNLTKHVPKTFMYPESSPSSPLPPQTLNAPTNSSIFMCMGFVDWINNSDSPTEGIKSYIEQTYTSVLSFKDI